MKKTCEVSDLRNKPLEELTDEQIKARLERVARELEHINKEKAKLDDMYETLNMELEKRKLSTELEEA